MIKCVIFDFDMTLIDSSQLKVWMDNREWGNVYRNIHLTSIYPGVHNILNELQELGVRYAIASNAPKGYIEKVLKYHKISCEFIVGYHDVINKKPASEAISLCSSNFNLNISECIYVGDAHIDYKTAENAGIKFFGVEWGTFNDIKVTRVNYANFIQKALNLVDSSPYYLGGSSGLIINNRNQYYLGYYEGTIKKKLLDLKSNNNQALEEWTSILNEVATALPKTDVVVRALGHNELTIQENFLCVLSRVIAKKTGAKYSPSLLQKLKPTLKSTSLSKAERFTQITGQYNVSSTLNKDDKISFLVIDDVITTSATTNEITRALHSTYPKAKVYIFSLVKTLLLKEIHKSIYQNKRLAALFDLINRRKSLSSLKNEEKRQSSKIFSSNYSYTNNNFIVQNLSPYSISAEARRSQYLPAIYIIRNILQRGTPSLCSRYLREKLHLDNFNKFTSVENVLISKDSLDWKRIIKGDTASNNFPAKYFYDVLINKYLGNFTFIKNLIIPEVKLFDITKVYIESLYNQSVDFYLPQAFLIIEIDGKQHKKNSQYDSYRDAHAHKYGVETLRLTTTEIKTENISFNEKIAWLINFLEKTVIEGERRKEFESNLITLGDYQQAFCMDKDISAPNFLATAVIRFQIVLLELLENGDLTLLDHWHIEIKCRDTIGFSKLAIEDLSLWFFNLLPLHNIKFDKLKYSVKYLKKDDEFSTDNSVKIDFSLFQRFTDEPESNPNVIYVRTHYLDEYKSYNTDDSNSINGVTYIKEDYMRLSTTTPLNYKLQYGERSSHKDNLIFFLENLFLPFVDNVSFREGQLGIITSALMRNDTIGLLPTGSGKSICYQLAAILQPAVSFVVCPIKSLMYDQKIDLDSVNITRTNFITSDQSPSEKETVQRDFARKKYFFIYISPERFQSKVFRNELMNINEYSTFAYAVIDEVHCMSEWGHDFRISYLNLANAISKLAPSSTYIGLTATASVNVLKDIQSEFCIEDINVKTPLNFTRDELHFDAINDFGNKEEALTKLIPNLKGKWQQENSKERKCGIIFTPHVNGNKGCYPLAGKLSSQLREPVHYYSGSVPKNFGTRIMSNSDFDKYKKEVQEGFKSNSFHLLTATKAFGMGVNKGNIAFTVHYGIPGSMEALYQEAGRAGREKKLFSKTAADCIILLSPEDYLNLDELWSPDISVKELKKHQDILKNSKSDVNTNLFMFLNGLDTINDDFKLIKLLYKSYYQGASGLLQTVDSGFLSANKEKVQKAIYRLVQLGIVKDWTVDNFFKGVYEVEFLLHEETHVKTALERTVRKYDSDFSISNLLSDPTGRFKLLVNKKNENKLTDLEFYFVVLLLWSYNHFAYNRRQSLKNIYEQCFSLAAKEISTAEFKNTLENYFKFNKSSNLLQHIADNPHELSKWFNVFYKDINGKISEELLSISEVSAVKDQLSRFLESYMNNVGLNFLSGIVRLIIGEFNNPDGRNRLISSFSTIKNYPKEKQFTIIKSLIDVLKNQINEDDKSELVKLIHDALGDNKIIRLLNKSFNDEYSLSVLLKIKVDKIKKLTDFIERTICQMHCKN